jgi:nucleoside-diphosphate-sugar epimerase
MHLPILITGATGFVGSHLARRLLKEDFPLVCATRSENKILGLQTLHIGDIDGNTDWTRCLNNINTVIHCAARVHVMNEAESDPLQAFRQVNVIGSLRLAEQAAQAGVRQFIYLSSVKVNGELSLLGRAFTEEDAPQASDAYGISKLEAEQALLALSKKTGMSITIIRPPLVYGAGVGANFLSMLRWVQKKVPLPLANIQNRRSLIYVENLVDLIVTCIQNPAADNQVFLASDGEDVSTSQLLQQAAHALQVPSRLFPFPENLLVFFAQLLGKKSVTDRLYQSLQVDISKAKNVLHWSPPFKLAEGLKACASTLTNTDNTNEKTR